jgi:hypothetical protein
MSAETARVFPLSPGDERIARAILPLLLHRRDTLNRLIEAAHEMQRTEAAVQVAREIALSLASAESES